MEKLNHLPFEEWLADRAQLSLDETRALQMHLEDCEGCRQLESALKTVDGLLRSAPLITPATGFAQRWQMRLAAQRAISQRRQTRLILTVTVGGALMLLALLALLLLPVFQSPLPFIVSGVYQVSKVYGVVNTVGGVVSTVGGAVFAVIPPTMWIAILLAASALGVIWAATIWRITTHRRVTS
jgi:hypothetical protein